MKEKILASIKLKFPDLNLTKKRLDEIAAKLESKIKDESEIDAQIDAFNDYNPLADIAKQDDAYRNLQTQLKKAATPPKKEDSEKHDNTEALIIPDDAAPYVKVLHQELQQQKQHFQTLSDQLSIIQKEKSKAEAREVVNKKLALVPEVIWAKRPMPETPEEAESFVTDVQNDYQALAQLQTENGLSKLPIPKGGNGKHETPQVDVKKVDAILDNIMPR